MKGVMIYNQKNPYSGLENGQRYWGGGGGGGDRRGVIGGDDCISKS